MGGAHRRGWRGSEERREGLGQEGLGQEGLRGEGGGGAQTGGEGGAQRLERTGVGERGGGKGGEEVLHLHFMTPEMFTKVNGLSPPPPPQEIHGHAVQLQSVEEELLQLLVSEETPMEDPSTTRRILALNNAHEETQERWGGGRGGDGREKGGKGRRWEGREGREDGKERKMGKTESHAPLGYG